MAPKTFNSIRSAAARLPVLAAFMLVGSVGVAQAAGPTDDVPHVVVSYRDLDLSSPEGVHTLYARIAAAARQVCPMRDARSAQLLASYQECREAAIERAVHHINNAQLAALKDEHARRG
jgi:UrcA family protein